MSMQVIELDDLSIFEKSAKGRKASPPAPEIVEAVETLVTQASALGVNESTATKPIRMDEPILSTPVSDAKKAKAQKHAARVQKIRELVEATHENLSIQGRIYTHARTGEVYYLIYVTRVPSGTAT